jgi:hypothetical protein
MTAQDDWIRTLRAATQTTISADGPSMPGQAVEGLRLAWTTTEAVHVPDADGEARWQQLRDHIETLSNEIAPLLGPPGIDLGTDLDTDRGPADMLTDSHQLFVTAIALTSASQAVAGDYWQGEISGAGVGAMARMDARARANVERVLREHARDTAGGFDDRLPSRAQVYAELPALPNHRGPQGPAAGPGLARG